MRFVTKKIKILIKNIKNIIKWVIFMGLILNLFSRGGLVMILILIGLEYACFPLPSEIVLPFSGFLVSMNGYSVVGFVILSVIVGYLGCLFCYLLGYYGGNYIYKKIYLKFPKWQKGLDETSNKFKKYGNVSVLICRVIPLCRTYISFFSGIFGQGLFKFSLYSVIGISIWNTVLILLGVVLKDNWNNVSFYYEKYKIILISLICLIICLFFLYKLYKKRKFVKTINGD